MMMSWKSPNLIRETIKHKDRTPKRWQPEGRKIVIKVDIRQMKDLQSAKMGVRMKMPLNLPTLEAKDRVENLQLQPLLVAVETDLVIERKLMCLEAHLKSQVSKLRMRPRLHTITVERFRELEFIKRRIAVFQTPPNESITVRIPA